MPTTTNEANRFRDSFAVGITGIFPRALEFEQPKDGPELQVFLRLESSSRTVPHRETSTLSAFLIFRAARRRPERSARRALARCTGS